VKHDVIVRVFPVDKIIEVLCVCFKAFVHSEKTTSIGDTQTPTVRIVHNSNFKSTLVENLSAVPLIN
jgi:hypothetical protein